MYAHSLISVHVYCVYNIYNIYIYYICTVMCVVCALLYLCVCACVVCACVECACVVCGLAYVVWTCKYNTCVYICVHACMCVYTHPIA